jgi:hypothetical protein
MYIYVCCCAWYIAYSAFLLYHLNFTADASDNHIFNSATITILDSSVRKCLELELLITLHFACTYIYIYACIYIGGWVVRAQRPQPGNRFVLFVRASRRARGTRSATVTSGIHTYIYIYWVQA